MDVGIPKELKDNEFRVAATPEGVRELTRAGHRVFVEASAGAGSAIDDDQYVAAGAEILPDADAVFAAAELIVKVKEPQPQEYERFRPGHVLFTYLHLAADERLTRFLADRGVASVAYETVQTADGRLPLLAPMSEIAGRITAAMSVCDACQSEPGALAWQVRHDSLVARDFQLSPCGVFGFAPVWQAVQLRRSCGKPTSE